MKSGTEKNPNPHEIPLGRYLRALARPMSQQTRAQYIRLASGQLVRRDKLMDRLAQHPQGDLRK